ncbi:hypothetical protein DFQ01_13111 [Paenibacillus cellulosilyticus]|uniref:Uncharacterized protein n=1 Tax=Paenibacillus cellulosilyticus TaxID=375489 RepID=A0A2V2YL83_9BACL|nr:hypothetical protein DFQ01_13111 [Paenibacillus cellulosilyticus]
MWKSPVSSDSSSNKRNDNRYQANLHLSSWIRSIATVSRSSLPSRNGLELIALCAAYSVKILRQITSDEHRPLRQETETALPSARDRRQAS